MKGLCKAKGCITSFVWNCAVKGCVTNTWKSSAKCNFFSLFFRSFYLSLEIKKALKNQPNKHQKINLICPNGVSYVVGQWAIWMSGNIVVPLSGQHTDNALEYFIKDSESSLVISSPELMNKVRIVASKYKPYSYHFQERKSVKFLSKISEWIFESITSQEMLAWEAICI